MSSPPGIKKNVWYSTPYLQIVLCFCCLIHNDLKKKHGKVEADAFWRSFHHLIPHVDEYLPEHHKNLPRKEYVNRFIQRGDKLNRYPTEHPTHPTKQETTGRFWGWAVELYNGPGVEFTVRREDIEGIVSKIEGRLPIVQRNMEELDEPESAIIDLNEIIERLDHLDGIFEDIEDRISMLEEYFQRKS